MSGASSDFIVLFDPMPRRTRRSLVRARQCLLDGGQAEMINPFEGLTRVMAESRRRREAKECNLALQNRALELQIKREDKGQRDYRLPKEKRK
jgi:hypothetical protein